jgi:hypothetical protein
VIIVSSSGGGPKVPISIGRRRNLLGLENKLFLLNPSASLFQRENYFVYFQDFAVSFS